ncbi:paxillin [Thecamonas trahens ATCC 50062]|uniref:Paxillin n=1 Tax=Thecamonas trahens ATCC 50062 TaxID=461836 RepID=A0A0L0D2K6_THETB|nr:paxillin [Thecamonas trahens ATCC 50062]KNC46421.1 paxillin [Thecamonas trahens ATCC 50062]|eukprot:XP_013760712.1 paxillin [Thecamonas trahens ATCC 50062]
MAADACQGCFQIIDTDSVNLKGVGKYHAKCFVCVECRGPLDADFHMKDGSLYCANHFNAKFGTRCAACNLFLSTQVLAAGEKKYHPACFVCASCNQAFSDGYVVRDDLPFCDSTCAERGPVCAECRKELTGTISRIGGRRYHVACVKCSVCKTPLGDDELKSKNGILYCPPDYNLKFGEHCYGCSKFLGEDRIKAMDHKWHPECFVCTACKTPFAGGSFVVDSNKPYCSSTCADA